MREWKMREFFKYSRKFPPPHHHGVKCPSQLVSTPLPGSIYIYTELELKKISLNMSSAFKQTFQYLRASNSLLTDDTGPPPRSSSCSSLILHSSCPSSYWHRREDHRKKNAQLLDSSTNRPQLKQTVLEMCESIQVPWTPLYDPLLRILQQYLIGCCWSLQSYHSNPTTPILPLQSYNYLSTVQLEP